MPFLRRPKRAAAGAGASSSSSSPRGLDPEMKRKRILAKKRKQRTEREKKIKDQGVGSSTSAVEGDSSTIAHGKGGMAKESPKAWTLPESEKAKLTRCNSDSEISCDEESEEEDAAPHTLEEKAGTLATTIYKAFNEPSATGVRQHHDACAEDKDGVDDVELEAARPTKQRKKNAEKRPSQLQDDEDPDGEEMPLDAEVMRGTDKDKDAAMRVTDQSSHAKRGVKSDSRSSQHHRQDVKETLSTKAVLSLDDVDSKLDAIVEASNGEVLDSQLDGIGECSDVGTSAVRKSKSQNQMEASFATCNVNKVSKLPKDKPQHGSIALASEIRGSMEIEKGNNGAPSNAVQTLKPVQDPGLIVKEGKKKDLASCLLLDSQMELAEGSADTISSDGGNNISRDVEDATCSGVDESPMLPKEKLKHCATALTSKLRGLEETLNDGGNTPVYTAQTPGAAKNSQDNFTFEEGEKEDLASCQLLEPQLAGAGNSASAKRNSALRSALKDITRSDVEVPQSPKEASKQDSTVHTSKKGGLEETMVDGNGSDANIVKVRKAVKESENTIISEEGKKKDLASCQPLESQLQEAGESADGCASAAGNNMSRDRMGATSSGANGVCELPKEKSKHGSIGLISKIGGSFIIAHTAQTPGGAKNFQDSSTSEEGKKALMSSTEASISPEGGINDPSNAVGEASEGAMKLKALDVASLLKTAGGSRDSSIASEEKKKDLGESSTKASVNISRDVNRTPVAQVSKAAANAKASKGFEKSGGGSNMVTEATPDTPVNQTSQCNKMIDDSTKLLSVNETDSGAHGLSLDMAGASNKVKSNSEDHVGSASSLTKGGEKRESKRSLLDTPANVGDASEDAEGSLGLADGRNHLGPTFQKNTGGMGSASNEAENLRDDSTETEDDSNSEREDSHRDDRKGSTCEPSKATCDSSASLNANNLQSMPKESESASRKLDNADKSNINDESSGGARKGLISPTSTTGASNIPPSASRAAELGEPKEGNSPGPKTVEPSKTDLSDQSSSTASQGNVTKRQTQRSQRRAGASQPRSLRSAVSPHPLPLGRIACPICGDHFDPVDIENHASHCGETHETLWSARMSSSSQSGRGSGRSRKKGRRSSSTSRASHTRKNAGNNHISPSHLPLSRDQLRAAARKGTDASVAVHTHGNKHVEKNNSKSAATPQHPTAPSNSNPTASLPRSSVPASRAYQNNVDKDGETFVGTWTKDTSTGDSGSGLIQSRSLKSQGSTSLRVEKAVSSFARVEQKSLEKKTKRMRKSSSAKSAGEDDADLTMAAMKADLTVQRAFPSVLEGGEGGLPRRRWLGAGETLGPASTVLPVSTKSYASAHDAIHFLQALRNASSVSLADANPGSTDSWLQSPNATVFQFLSYIRLARQGQLSTFQLMKKVKKLIFEATQTSGHQSVENDSDLNRRDVMREELMTKFESFLPALYRMGNVIATSDTVGQGAPREEREKQAITSGNVEQGASEKEALGKQAIASDTVERVKPGDERELQENKSCKSVGGAATTRAEATQGRKRKNEGARQPSAHRQRRAIESDYTKPASVNNRAAPPQRRAVEGAPTKPASVHNRDAPPQRRAMEGAPTKNASAHNHAAPPQRHVMESMPNNHVPVYDHDAPPQSRRAVEGAPTKPASVHDRAPPQRQSETNRQTISATEKTSHQHHHYGPQYHPMPPQNNYGGHSGYYPVHHQQMMSVGHPAPQNHMGFQHVQHAAPRTAPNHAMGYQPPVVPPPQQASGYQSAPPTVPGFSPATMHHSAPIHAPAPGIAQESAPSHEPAQAAQIPTSTRNERSGGGRDRNSKQAEPPIVIHSDDKRSEKPSKTRATSVEPQKKHQPKLQNNKPQLVKPKNPFTHFCRDVKPSIQKELAAKFSHLSQKDLAKEVQKEAQRRWKALGVEERKVYEHKSRMDHARCEKEMKESSVPLEVGTKMSSSKAAARDASFEPNRSKNPDRTNNNASIQPAENAAALPITNTATKSAKPKNPFTHFCRDVKPRIQKEIAAQLPHLLEKELTKSVQKEAQVRWKALSKEERKVYEHKSSMDHARWQKESAIPLEIGMKMIPTNGTPPKPQRTNDTSTKPNRAKNDRTEPVENAAILPVRNTATKPAKPKNPFTHFCRKVKPCIQKSLASQCPHLSKEELTKRVQKEAQVRWKALGLEERKQYEEMSRIEHARYDLEVGKATNYK